MTHPPPVVLALGGHDPTGGAGISADIQTLSRLGCHPASVITALTVQDTHGVHSYQCVDHTLAQRQCEVLLDDLSVAAIKTGMLGCDMTLRTLAPLIKTSRAPLVVDPVLTAGDGSALAQDELAQALMRELIPAATVVTPNIHEALALTGAGDVAGAAARLLATGCTHVFITATDAGSGAEISHRLFDQNGTVKQLSCPRLPGRYHGSGCTLASAIAAYLALGHSIVDAIENAQAFTFASLRRAYQLNDGQALPHRLFSDGTSQ